MLTEENKEILTRTINMLNQNGTTQLNTDDIKTNIRNIVDNLSTINDVLFLIGALHDLEEDAQPILTDLNLDLNSVLLTNISSIICQSNAPTEILAVIARLDTLKLIGLKPSSIKNLTESGSGRLKVIQENIAKMQERLVEMLSSIEIDVQKVEQELKSAQGSNLHNSQGDEKATKLKQLKQLQKKFKPLLVKTFTKKTFNDPFLEMNVDELVKTFTEKTFNDPFLKKDVDGLVKTFTEKTFNDPFLGMDVDGLVKDLQTVTKQVPSELKDEYPELARLSSTLSDLSDILLGDSGHSELSFEVIDDLDEENKIRQARVRQARESLYKLTNLKGITDWVNWIKQEHADYFTAGLLNKDIQQLLSDCIKSLADKKAFKGEARELIKLVMENAIIFDIKDLNKLLKSLLKKDTDDLISSVKGQEQLIRDIERINKKLMVDLDKAIKDSKKEEQSLDKQINVSLDNLQKYLKAESSKLKVLYETEKQEIKKYFDPKLKLWERSAKDRKMLEMDQKYKSIIENKQKIDEKYKQELENVRDQQEGEYAKYHEAQEEKKDIKANIAQHEKKWKELNSTFIHLRNKYVKVAQETARLQNVFNMTQASNAALPIITGAIFDKNEMTKYLRLLVDFQDHVLTSDIQQKEIFQFAEDMSRLSPNDKVKLYDEAHIGVPVGVPAEEFQRYSESKIKYGNELRDDTQLFQKVINTKLREAVVGSIDKISNFEDFQKFIKRFYIDDNNIDLKLISIISSEDNEVRNLLTNKCLELAFQQKENTFQNNSPKLIQILMSDNINYLLNMPKLLEEGISKFIEEDFKYVYKQLRADKKEVNKQINDIKDSIKGLKQKITQLDKENQKETNKLNKEYQRHMSADRDQELTKAKQKYAGSRAALNDEGRQISESFQYAKQEELADIKQKLEERSNKIKNEKKREIYEKIKAAIQSDVVLEQFGIHPDADVGALKTGLDRIIKQNKQELKNLSASDRQAKIALKRQIKNLSKVSRNLSGLLESDINQTSKILPLHINALDTTSTLLSRLQAQQGSKLDLQGAATGLTDSTPSTDEARLEGIKVDSANVGVKTSNTMWDTLKAGFILIPSYFSPSKFMSKKSNQLAAAISQGANPNMDNESSVHMQDEGLEGTRQFSQFHNLTDDSSSLSSSAFKDKESVNSDHSQSSTRSSQSESNTTSYLSDGSKNTSEVISADAGSSTNSSETTHRTMLSSYASSHSSTRERSSIESWIDEVESTRSASEHLDAPTLPEPADKQTRDSLYHPSYLSVAPGNTRFNQTTPKKFGIKLAPCPGLVKTLNKPKNKIYSQGNLNNKENLADIINEKIINKLSNVPINSEEHGMHLNCSLQQNRNTNKDLGDKGVNSQNLTLSLTLTRNNVSVNMNFLESPLVYLQPNEINVINDVDLHKLATNIIGRSLMLEESKDFLTEFQLLNPKKVRFNHDRYNKFVYDARKEEIEIVFEYLKGLRTKILSEVLNNSYDSKVSLSLEVQNMLNVDLIKPRAAKRGILLLDHLNNEFNSKPEASLGR